MQRQSFSRSLDPAVIAATGEPSAAMSGPDVAILSLVDPGAESRVVLFVPGALELACALLRRGVSETMMVRPGQSHRLADADIAIIPRVPSAEFLCAAIHDARAMLVPLSTITVRIDRVNPDELLTLARQRLLLHGFTAIRTETVCGVVLIRAELPLCGRVACA